MNESSEKRKPVEAPQQPKSKKSKKKHTDPKVLALRQAVQLCCKTNDLATAMDVYESGIQDGVQIEAQTFYNLLNLCDGLGDRGMHVGTPTSSVKNDETDVSQQKEQIREVSLDVRLEYAKTIRTRMDELKIPLTETAYSGLVKLLTRMGNLQEAEETIEEAEKVQQCRSKLRLYNPLLVAYCLKGDAVAAVKVWLRVVQQDLTLTEKEYHALIQCATLAGCAVLMERVLTDLSEDVLVPSRETREAIVAWFESPHSKKTVESQDDDKEIIDILKQIEAPEASPANISMGPVVCSDSQGWIISDNCGIDTACGRLQSGCLENAVLNPVMLSAEIWNKMKELNETIVVSGKLVEDSSNFQGGRKGPKRELDDKALEERRYHWRHFQDYIERRNKDSRIEIVIDGANIGYNQQNYAGAPKHVDYEQIDWVVQHFVEQKKSTLLIMHCRHFSPKMMPRKFQHTVNKWLDLGVLYRTPPGMNDDWFWLHVALETGPGTLVVTNDEMRDHHFQMLAPRSFLRWKDRHQVHFEFGQWTGSSPDRRREVLLTFPDQYSRRIQRVRNGVVIPLPKRGDEKRFLDGSFIADNGEPVEERYLCVRPMQY